MCFASFWDLKFSESKLIFVFGNKSCIGKWKKRHFWDIDKEVLGYFKHTDTVFHSSGCFLLLERAKKVTKQN